MAAAGDGAQADDERGPNAHFGFKSQLTLVLVHDHRTGKGTGQGLAIAHAVIVDQHQGQLTFETEVGVGTSFIIRLPLHPQARGKPEVQP